VTSEELRFWGKVRIGDGCWEWTGAIAGGSGYGSFRRSSADGRRANSTGAHRVSWLLARGAIPEGLYVCHRCDNRKCVRPSHLFLGTHQDNTNDCISKGRQQRGGRHANAKLTEALVLEARRRVSGGELLSIIAQEFGVSPNSLSVAVSGARWRHVGPGIPGARHLSAQQLARLRELASRSSFAAVAARAGLGRSVVNRIARGGVASRRTLAKLEPLLVSDSTCDLDAELAGI
jgi:hypothetical protein